jgi:broad specificity phosphatase PhoE
MFPNDPMTLSWFEDFLALSAAGNFSRAAAARHMTQPAFSRRIRSLEARLIARWTGQTVLLVTHVTPVKLLVRDALRAPIESVFRMELAPASLTEVHWWPDGTASMRRFNETAAEA